MRQPSDRGDAWAWWRLATTTDLNPVPPMQPQCGLFKSRRKSGQWVAASIDIEQPKDPETGELCGDERLVCLIDGWERDVDANWFFLAAHPVTEAEHTRLSNAPRVSDLSREVIV